MNIVIIGASKGLGHALATGLSKDARHFYLVSRSEPKIIRDHALIPATWIKADLLDPEFPSELTRVIGDAPVQLLIYNAGIWESNGFEVSYRFESDKSTEISNIITTNLTSAIHCVQALLPNLKCAGFARIILIGSTSGMENNHTREVAYQASKFGLRGLNNALRENFRGMPVTSTILNIGSLATQASPEREGGAGQKIDSVNIPLTDIVKIVECILNLSSNTIVKELDLLCASDPAV